MSTVYWLDNSFGFRFAESYAAILRASVHERSFYYLAKYKDSYNDLTFCTAGSAGSWCEQRTPVRLAFTTAGGAPRQDEQDLGRQVVLAKRSRTGDGGVASACLGSARTTPFILIQRGGVMLSWKDHLRLLLAGVSVFGLIELATPSTALAAGSCRADYCTNTRCNLGCVYVSGGNYLCNYGYWDESIEEPPTGSGDVSP